MPPYVNRLNYNYWTSLSRLGCSGKIKNCFSNQTFRLTASYAKVDEDFWSEFDRTDSGACVALQTVPPNKESAANFANNPLAPVFSGCGNFYHLACEGKGPRSKYVAESKITVKTNIFC